MELRDTGLFTKDETVKTTQNAQNLTIYSLIFGLCFQFCTECPNKVDYGGLPTKYETVKTTQNSIKITI